MHSNGVMPMPPAMSSGGALPLCSAKSLRGACAPSTAPSTNPCIQAEPPEPCGSRSTAIS
jgi:hypothetical protein